MRRLRLAQPAAGGQPAVDEVHGGPGDAGGGGRLVEGLQLDEQLVDHPGHPFAPGAPGARAGGADGVDLLDEADRPAFAAGVGPQGLEVGADLAVGLAVVHRLERRRRHEQERHAGLCGHGLGQVGLARAGRPLEEDASAGRAPHAITEGLVGEE